jgi:hypothetical protein
MNMATTVINTIVVGFIEMDECLLILSKRK